MEKVQGEIEKGANLKHVDTEDKSKPVLEKVQVKKVDRDGFLKEVETTDTSSLKKTEEKKDSSAPKIEAGTSVQQVDRVAQLQTVKHGVVTHGIEQYKGTEALKAVDSADRSAPVIDKDVKVKTYDKSGLLAEVAKGPDGGLKSVEEMKDSSAPKIDTNTSVKQVDRVAQMQGVKHGAVTRDIDGFKGAVPLQAAEGCRDASEPVIDKDVKIKSSNRGDLMAEVSKGPEGGLKAVDEKKDSSAPKIEANTSVKQVDRVAQMQDVKHGAVARDIDGFKGAVPLQATECCRDASGPVIDKDVKIKPSGRGELMAEVSKGVEGGLKPTEQKDSSAPKIDPNTSVKQVDRLAQMQDVKRGAVTRDIEGFKGAAPLQAAEGCRDASAPMIDPDVKVKPSVRGDLMAEVTKGVEGGLKPTEEQKDGSAPKIDANTSIKQVDRVAQMQGVKHGAVTRDIEGFKGATPLQATDGLARDGSAPVIDKDVKIKPSTRGELMTEVTKGVEGGLKPTEEQKDSSAPKTEGASVQRVDRVAQMQTIMHGVVTRDIEGFKGATPLQTVDGRHDASAPVIDPDVKVKTIDRKGLVAGVTEPHDLKRPESVRDASAPAIEKDTKLKSNAFGAVLKEVAEKK